MEAIRPEGAEGSAPTGKNVAVERKALNVLMSRMSVQSRDQQMRRRANTKPERGQRWTTTDSQHFRKQNGACKMLLGQLAPIALLSRSQFLFHGDGRDPSKRHTIRLHHGRAYAVTPLACEARWRHAFSQNASVLNWPIMTRKMPIEDGRLIKISQLRQRVGVSLLVAQQQPQALHSLADAWELPPTMAL